MGSPYAQNRGGGGSPYAQNRGSGGSAYATSRGGSAPAPKAKSRGFLGSIGHVVGQKLDLAGRDIKGIGGGVVEEVRRGVVDPWKDVITTGHVSKGTNKNIDRLIAQNVDSIQYTANHPGADPFATLLLGLPLLHGAGRVGVSTIEGARAARAGEGVKGVVRAASQKPGEISRGLTQGGKETPLIPSKGGAGRLAQMGYDKVVQGALDKNEAGHATGPISRRVAAHGAKRIGGALGEENRVAQRMKAVPSAMLDKAAGKLSKTRGARREEQAALELTSAQTLPHEAADYHLAQAAKGVNPKQNLGVAKLYQRVAKRGLVKLDGAHVVIDSVAHPKLAKVDAALAHVQSKGDQILVEHGVRDSAALQARIDAPGRIRAGAQFEKPTPAKGGIESPALKRERSRLVSLQARYEGALNSDAETLTKDRNRDLGPLSEADAKTRLAELDKRYEAGVKKLIPETFPYGREAQQRETAYRNAASAKPRARKQATVKDEEFQIAENKLHEIAATNPDHPVAKRIASVIAERDKLRNALNQRAETAFAGGEAASLPSAPARLHASVPAGSRPHLNRIVQLGHALEAQKARVAQMESQAAARIKPTGIVGGETARPGRGFVSERVSDKKLSKAEVSSSRGEVIGEAKSPITNASYTGRALQQGFRPKHVTLSASAHFRQILKFANTHAQRLRALETGSDFRRSNRDILARIPGQTAEKLSADVEQALGRQTSNVDTAEELATMEGLKAAHEAFKESMFYPGQFKARFAGDRAQALGTKAPEGYKWVDRNTLGDAGRASPEAPDGLAASIRRKTDTVNSAVTAATVYFKVGHVGTRVLTNAVTNMTQGSANPLQMKYGTNLWRDLDEEWQARSLAAAGQHGFASLPHEGTNFVAVAAGKGAQWWAKHADAMFRFNSLSYELRKAGYDTTAKFKQAIDHLETSGQGMPAHEWSKLSAAARRADREAISYDRLNDFEKRYITRAVWFYPWIKGSTLFTVRTAIEHPFKSAALGEAGVQGRQLQEQQLGPSPSYEAGLFKLGGSASNPLVADFSTFSPFATSADVIDAPAQPGAYSGFLNPVAGAAGQFLYGLNQFGGASQTPYQDALLALGAATPEQQVAEAIASQGQDQSNRMFRKTPWNTFARFGVGPGLPRHVNRDALASAAAREKSGRR